MAKRKRPDPETELPLFDLPLHPQADDEPATKAGGAEAGDAEAGGAKAKGAKARAGAAARKKTAKTGKATDRDEPNRDEGEGEPAHARLFASAEETEDEPEPAIAAAPFLERLRAGLADLAVHVLMLAVAVTAAYRLGVFVTWSYWPPFAVLSLVFSFLYWVIPLAFWGQTPGMAWVGHLARGLDDEPLTFQQTFLRWLGALFTFGFAGLPLLLALAGSSLSDRLSQSKTVSVGDPAQYSKR